MSDKPPHSTNSATETTTVGGVLCGALFASLCVVSSILGTIYVLIPFFILIYVKPKFWRRCADNLIGFWLTLPLFLIEFFYKIEVRVTGDAILGAHPAVMIMNHRTRLDWLYFWGALYRIDPWLLTTEKISMKKSLRVYPGIGWAMQCDSFLFLDRQWETDTKVLSDSMTYFKDMDRAYQLLFFPEGNDLDSKGRLKSDKYAEDKGLVKYQQVLHPKTKGFAFLIAKMRELNYGDFIYDITVAYPNNIVHFEGDFAKGKCPSAVCFHVRRFAIKDLPTDEGDLQKWVVDTWERKEQILKEFYAKPPGQRSLNLYPETDRVWPGPLSGRARLILALMFPLWMFVTMIWAFFLVAMPGAALWWYLLFGFCFYYSFLWRYDGIQRYVIGRWNRARGEEDAHKKD